MAKKGNYKIITILYLISIFFIFVAFPSYIGVVFNTMIYWLSLRGIVFKKLLAGGSIMLHMPIQGDKARYISIPIFLLSLYFYYLILSSNELNLLGVGFIFIYLPAVMALGTYLKKHMKSEKEKPKQVKAGLGGWLILVGLGLVAGAILAPFGLVGYVSYLSENHNIPGFSSVLWAGITFQIILLISNCYLLYLFFKKNKKFPPYYIIFIYFLIAWAIINYYMVNSLIAPTAEAKNFLKEYLSDTKSSSIGSLIWVLYMHKSKRVKATFVNS
jgi:hypothetical protein